jgi:large subunit ribosomal protein L15
MMDLSSLKYAKGSIKDRKRVGRGGSRGKTAGRGDKGQRSRSGAKRRLWFEGGQMPIQRRLPKRGFKNLSRVDFQVVNVAELAKCEDVTEITPEVMYDKKIVRKKNVPIKVLGNGEITKKLTVTANAFSKAAMEKIESAGGRTIIL